MKLTGTARFRTADAAAPGEARDRRLEGLRAGVVLLEGLQRRAQLLDDRLESVCGSAHRQLSAPISITFRSVLVVSQICFWGSVLCLVTLFSPCKKTFATHWGCPLKHR